MIKIKKSSLAIVIACTAAVTLLVAAACFFVFARVNDVTLVNASKYTRMEKIATQYSKLYQLQNEINNNGLWKISKTKQMNAIYKGLFDSLDDEPCFAHSARFDAPILRQENLAYC